MSTLPPIRISDDVSSFIRTLHPVLKKRVHAALQELRANPGDGKQLQDEITGYRSFRVGKFRIIYRTASRKEIEIVAVGPRRTIYEETVRLMAKME
ncbi:MAG TPA: type II toxin-antitoxin system RelE/ParE family toxin [Nitrospirota bacterium]|nr:type II toxin-antitoxin system RelE/ParE family toxin [Nitrospirota bacterium]